MYKLYSPPSGSFPQELPQYWRFDNGEVRTDLPTLTDAELFKLGWTGPYQYPVAKNTLMPDEPYDYDPETHSVIWNSGERKFQIVERSETEIEESAFIPFENLEISKPKWVTFKEATLSSVTLNTVLSEAIGVVPLAALAFPATFLKLENGEYGDFSRCWKAIANAVTIPEELIEEFVELANSCNLPSQFVSILTGE